MPTHRLHARIASSARRGPHGLPIILAMAVACGLPPVASAESSTPVSIRSRQLELHYRVNGTSDGVVELWFTRDRGMTWQSAGTDADGKSPVVFSAPGEGLFGFVMIPRVGGQPVRPAPKPHEAPQRWAFIDATPPLAQWNGVEPVDEPGAARTIQLRWTAHDDNLAARPIGLSYRSSIDQVWHPIDDAVANTGLYDWTVPAEVAGSVTFKLLVRDEGGHSVERLFGPLSLDKYLRVGNGKPQAAENATARAADSAKPQAVATVVEETTPAASHSDILLATGTQPSAAPSRTDLLKQRMAADLYRQASWHLLRGQYAVAAERLRESLEQDPDLLEARHDLAGIFYRQEDYDRAITEYQGVLSRDPNYESALYGAALAYVAKRDYHHSRDMLSRLLTVNDRNAEAWLDLGDVLFMMGDVINARGHWRRAIKIDPSADELVQKARRRLDLYGSEQLSSAK